MAKKEDEKDWEQYKNEIEVTKWETKKERAEKTRIWREKRARKMF